MIYCNTFSGIFNPAAKSLRICNPTFLLALNAQMPDLEIRGLIATGLQIPPNVYKSPGSTLSDALWCVYEPPVHPIFIQTKFTALSEKFTQCSGLIHSMQWIDSFNAVD